MSIFAQELAGKVEGYIALRRSLGYAFHKQAAVLWALSRYVEAGQLDGPLTRDMALNFVFSREGTANGRAVRHGVVRRFCEYLAIYDARTETLDPHALPRSRAIPPPRILSDMELGSLMSACRRVSPGYPQRGVVLTTLVGLLASTGLRSGEALRLNRTDVDLVAGVLHIRRSKFRKDRLVPVHATTLTALRQYAQHRDVAFSAPKDSAFFLSSRGNRLSSAGLHEAFSAARELAGLNSGKTLRPHDLRHTLAMTLLQSGVDLLTIQAWLGHSHVATTHRHAAADVEMMRRGLDKAGAGGKQPARFRPKDAVLQLLESI